MKNYLYVHHIELKDINVRPVRQLSQLRFRLKAGGCIIY